MITDIMLIIAVAAGPIFILIMALSYRWYYSLLPFTIFVAFWILWFILNTTVPFDVMSKLWWFVLAIGTCLASMGIGLAIRWYTIKEKCDPKTQECKF